MRRSQPALYADAVAGLSSSDGVRRIGALRTLEALDAVAPQAIVDVICAFLRGSGAPDDAARVAAQRMLARRLHPAHRRFWPGMTVDLASATLLNLDLSGCRADGGLRLDQAVLLGQTRLRGTIVGGAASLRGVQCDDHAWCERSLWHCPVFFDGATFAGDAWFGEAVFAGWTSFSGVDFGGHAWFGGASFGAPVDFAHAVFRRSAGFRGAVAHAGVGLGGTTFLGPARVSRRGGPARVSRRDEEWNIVAPGWTVEVDPDNGSVGQLLWIGHPELVDHPSPS